MNVGVLVCLVTFADRPIALLELVLPEALQEEEVVIFKEGMRNDGYSFLLVELCFFEERVVVEGLEDVVDGGWH